MTFTHVYLASEEPQWLWNPLRLIPAMVIWAEDAQLSQAVMGLDRCSSKENLTTRSLEIMILFFMLSIMWILLLLWRQGGWCRGGGLGSIPTSAIGFCAIFPQLSEVKFHRRVQGQADIRMLRPLLTASMTFGSPSARRDLSPIDAF